MFFLLIIVVALVAWALHLMQEAIQKHEFSLMLAGFLVSTAAAALVAVYFLMGNYVGYMTEMANHARIYESFYYENNPGQVDSAEFSDLDSAWMNNLVELSDSSSAQSY